MTGIDRRTFFTLLAALPFSLRAKVEDQNGLLPQLLLSGCQEKDGTYHLLAVNLHSLHNGRRSVQEVFRHRLPARAHQVLVDQDGSRAIVLERRPGTRIDLLDLQKGTLLQRVHCEDGFHLYGHAQISTDGRYLITAEQKAGSENGLLVFRDGRNPKKN